VKGRPLGHGRRKGPEPQPAQGMQIPITRQVTFLSSMIQVAPQPDGGKQLTIIDAPGATAYVLPLTPEAAQDISRKLAGVEIADATQLPPTNGDGS
jgi:hypothetical protein